MYILGIETSCDETSASIVADGQIILSNEVATSLAEHSQFGGVVPEIASRRHLEWMIETITSALTKANLTLGQVSAVAVTQGPGLPGALIVGISMAKALALALEKPILGIHHLQAHLYANFLSQSNQQSPAIEFPYMGLIVSGGHTILVLVHDVDQYKVIGQTLDDAVGEAFDKVAKLLGLGYPGGPVIDAKAKKGNLSAIAFPRAMIHEKNFDFSFSGIKTAVLRIVANYMTHPQDGRCEVASEKQSAKTGVKKEGLSIQAVNDICASFQEAVVDVLVRKSLQACQEFKTKHLIVGGGVSANSRLRERLTEEGKQEKIQVFFPPKGLSIDNAAMVAGLAGALWKKGYSSNLSLMAQPNWNIETAIQATTS